MIMVESAAMLTRVVVAAVFTLCLFLLMRFLITPDDGVPQKVESSPTVSITRHEREENTHRKQRNKPDRPEQKTTPPPPQLVQSRPQRMNNNAALSIELPEFEEGAGLGELGAPGDRRAIPVVRIPPQYPNRALSRGIEGWVILEFTISMTGTVENVQVLDSDPARVFDRAAIRAIARWKYQPKLVNGKPVAQPGMREQVTFKIED